MKLSINSFFFVVVFTTVLLLINLACKKDKSCENCIEINNQPPIARAGTDQKIVLPLDSVLLDGSQSKDADGRLVSYQWKKISGSTSFTIAKADSAKTQVKG